MLNNIFSKNIIIISRTLFLALIISFEKICSTTVKCQIFLLVVILILRVTIFVFCIDGWTQNNYGIGMKEAYLTQRLFPSLETFYTFFV